jgi:alkylation response protein AidB-like acyl-CoA dehydrogenase
MTAVVDQLRDLVASGGLDLPPIGDGATSERWHTLAELARRNVSLGRLAEAHVDAVQILREADRSAASDRLLGVWASEHPQWTVSAEPTADGLVLRGAKAFCSGAGIVDEALVTVVTSSGPLLVLVTVGDLEPERIDASAWRTAAMADTATATVDLDGIEVAEEQIVGAAAWYLERPGFWHGAVGPAACWAGAALGLVDHAESHAPTDVHGRAHLGSLIADAWALHAILDRAGREVDAIDGAEPAGVAQTRALIVRHLVDDRCESVQRHVERALGPRPLVADPDVIERHAALTLYRRQCHGERDLAALAESALGGALPA